MSRNAMAGGEPETSELVERAHEEDLTESPDQGPIPIAPPLTIPHIVPAYTAITIPPRASPSFPAHDSALGPSSSPSAARYPVDPSEDPLETVPHPLFYRPTHPLPNYIDSRESSPAKPAILESPSSPAPNPCPVDFHARPTAERFSSSPSSKAGDVEKGMTVAMATAPSLRVSELIHHVDAQQKDQQRWLRCSCLALTALIALVVIAFVGGVYYLAHIHPSLGTATVQNAMIANGAVTGDKLAAQAVTNAALSPPVASLLSTLNDSYVASLPLLPMAGVGLSQAPGTRVFAVNTDSVTLVIANDQLTIAKAGIQTAQLAPASITSAALSAGAVTAVGIAPGAVTVAQLGADVVSGIDAMNATASAAYAALPSAGVGIQIVNSQVDLVLDPTYLSVTSGGQLTITAGSLGASLFTPSSISAVSMDASVLATVPQAGAGLVSVYTPFNSTVMSLYTDNSSLVLSPSGGLSLGLVSSRQIAPGAVTGAQLSSAVLSELAALNATASQALQASIELTLTESFLQQQLLTALGLQDSDVLHLANLSSSQLLGAIDHINSTAFTALSSVNFSTYQLSSVLSADVSQLQQELSSTYANLSAQLPIAGAGIAMMKDARPRFNLLTDGRYFEASASGLAMVAGSVDARALGSGAISAEQIAVGAVTTAAIANGSVALSHLAPNASSVLSLMSAANNTLSVGVQGQDVSITRPAGGDLILTPGSAVGNVLLRNADGNSTITLGADGSVNAVGASMVLSSNGTVEVTAQSLVLSGANVTVSSAAASVNASAGNLKVTGQQTLISSGSSLTVQSASAAITSPHVSVGSPVQFVPQTVTLGSAATSYSVDFSTLTTSVIRLAGNASALTLSMPGCSEAFAGRAVSIYNQLDSQAAITVPAQYCSRTTDLPLLPSARLTVACAGTYAGSPAYDCQQSELPTGGLLLDTSVQVISNNVVNGQAASPSSVGVLELSFSPVNNLNPIVSFVLQSALFTEGATAVLLTAISSGFTNEVYASDKMTPVWVVGGQLLDPVGGAVRVTMVNVGDPLYAGQQQLMAFLYQIV